MSYTIDNVYQAIDALNGQDPQASSAAANWLGLFQKSMDSWLIADKIISEAKSYEATIFAAQTIRQKILFDFRELLVDSNSYVSLRNSIIYHLRSLESKIVQNSFAIMIQLAAALADLYLQVPNWNNFIGEMLQELSQSNNVLLTLFKIFPEELYNRSLRVGENRRRAVEKELAEKTDLVIQLLSHLCETNGSDSAIQTKVIACLSSWLLNKQCSTEALAQCQLLHSILYALKLPECVNDVHNAACECIVNALFLIENTESHAVLAKVLQERIYDTVDAFNAAAAKEDQEKLQNYARIYCELCESFLPQIMADPGHSFGDLRSLDMILIIVGYYDYTLAEMTFNVWYRLSEFLYQAQDFEFAQLRVVFRPYIERYIMSLYKHCKLETDMQGVVSPDSEIAEFREKAAESIKDVTFIIGSVELLKNMMNLLNTCSNGTWEEMESALFVISCIIHNIIETEAEVLPVLLNAILSFSSTTHVMLLNTTAHLLGNLNEWLSVNSSYLVPTVQWLISLSSGDISLLKTLAESLENICEKGSRHLANFFDPIHQIMIQIEEIPRNGQAMENASHYLLRACTYLINELPVEEISLRLEQLCARPIEWLNKIISNKNNDNTFDKENAPDSWKRLSSDPVLWLDRLGAIFRVLKPWLSSETYKLNSCHDNSNRILPNSQNLDAPWLDLATRIWQTVSKTLEHFKQFTRVAEHSCRTIRFLIRSMGIQSIVFIEDLAHQIMKVYSEHPHSCFLYLASIIVDQYGGVDHVQDGLITMMNTLAQSSFVLLHDENSFREHPDTVDDLFRLAIRFVQRSPLKFFSEPIFDMLFNGAIIGIGLDHSDANRSVTKFIIETIDAARKSKNQNNATSNAEKIVLMYGDKLVWHTLNASLFRLPNSLKKEMSEIIFAIGQFSKEKQAEWLSIAVQNVPHDSGLTATSQQLNEFKEQTLK